MNLAVFPYLYCTQKQKSYQQPHLTFKLATFFTNLRTSLYGNIISHYFQADPPTLDCLLATNPQAYMLEDPVFKGHA